MYFKSVLRHEFVILDASVPDTLVQREPGCEDPCLFSEAKRALRTKSFAQRWPGRRKIFCYFVRVRKPFS